MSAEREVILIQPSFKAYAEFIAVAVVLLFYEGIGVLVFAAIWYHQASRRYEIFPDKIVFTKGLVMKTTRTIRIGRIKDIAVRQNSLQRPLDVGDVVLLMAREEPPLKLSGIPHPVEFSKLLRKYRKDLHDAVLAARAAREHAAAQAIQIADADIAPDTHSDIDAV